MRIVLRLVPAEGWPPPAIVFGHVTVGGEPRSVKRQMPASARGFQLMSFFVPFQWLDKGNANAVPIMLMLW